MLESKPNKNLKEDGGMIIRKPLYVVLSRIMFTLLLLAFATTLAFAQADQATITGVVTDKTGALLPAAEVTLTNMGTSLTLKTKTDSGGVYIFSPVKIGNYKVVVSAGGFATVVRENVHLDVQQRLSLDFTLTPGGVTDTVTVTALPPLMQTEDASVGQVLSEEALTQTPLNGRNWVYIAQLTAGVAPPEGTRGTGKGDFNANGQRAEQNNYILDGVDNNSNSVDFLNGASYVVRPPPDALAEFKMQTSDYSAEFGHSAGAVVNASLKTGTNNIHGAIWEYVRNNIFDANDWENKAQGNAVPHYRQNQFGGMIGLPLLKNKLFFFGDAEANRIIFQETNFFTVPGTAGDAAGALYNMYNGDFRDLTSGAFTGSPIALTDPGTSNPLGTACGNPYGVMCSPNSVAKALLKLYPAANVNTGGSGYSNYVASRKSADDTTQYDLRLDWNVSARDQAFARFSRLDEPGLHPAPLGPVLDGGNALSYGDDGNVTDVGENFALSETHLFTQTLVNEFRFGYNWGHFGLIPENAGNTNLSATEGLGGIPGGNLNGGLPQVNIGNTITGFGTGEYYPANEYQNVFQLLDNISMTKRNHSLKAGVSFQHVRAYTSEPPMSRGEYNYAYNYSWSGCGTAANTFTGNGVSDFLADKMACAELSDLGGTDDVRWARSFYAQDDWKASSKLTLNLGVRYEYPESYAERHGRQAEWYTTGPLVAGNTSSTYLMPSVDQSMSLGSVLPGLLSADHVTVQYSSNPTLVNPNKLNLAPRIGIAYKVNSKATVRGGYGIFYGGLENAGYSPNLGMNAPFVFQSAFNSTGPGQTDGLTLANGFTAAITAGLLNALSSPSLRGMDPNPKTPYTEDYSLALEYGLSNNMVTTLSYVGATGRHLVVLTMPNAPLALTNGIDTFASSYQPLPDFGNCSNCYISFAGISSYSALQAKLERRTTAGLGFLASYTWSHSLDDAATPLGANGDNGYANTNVQPIRAQYSNSPFDTRQRVTLSANYQLPFGKGKRFAKNAGVGDYLVGGWSTTLSFVAQTGNPFSVTPNSGVFSPANGLAMEYAVKIADPFKGGGMPPANNSTITCPATVRNRAHWYNPCAFANPAPGTNLATNQTVSGAAAAAYIGGIRDQVYGPGYERVNMSLFKDFKLVKKTGLEFRADVFNLLNSPSLANPNSNFSGGGATSGDTSIDQSGGQITLPRMFQANTPDARFFQLSLKLSY
jgi:hypothetical protein